MKTKHPMQPLIIDNNGVVRFKENKIVRYLLDNGGIDLNKIALLSFSIEDQEQFAQLIGYSVCGFAELNYASDKAVRKADKAVKKLLKKTYVDRQKGDYNNEDMHSNSKGELSERSNDDGKSSFIAYSGG